jgi:NADH:ubiquinone oxidoreductase subunit 5 (subunit L)/multisubunit Na+/H+ antiporter MnhA subunit
MDLTPYIQIFILIPLIGFFISLVVKQSREKWLSAIAYTTAGLQLILFLPFLVYWLIQGAPVLNLKEFALYESSDYVFLVDFFFDEITAVYLFVGSALTFLITIYSRYYLHRETGYKAFFNSILLFYLGYNWTIFSGNFETLFIGWEILGLSSFLLIAFYRERYLPVRNAIKVFSIYRIGDVGILMAMWASHHLWHENITFLKLENAELVHEHISGHSAVGMFIAFMLLLAAAAKSAQLPFSSWLPRAMEGPTPSSAIFYGSLSVHFGVFLLLRTFPLWQDQIIARVSIGLLGLFTAVIATLISRVQSSVKPQIAYASIAQIGIMFIEVACGLETLALIHFAGNAFLRSYQLLVSPSIASYRIREQLYNYIPRPHTFEDSLPRRLEYSIYQLSVKEWNLDKFINKIIFTPLKKLGQKISFINLRNLFIFFIPTYLLGVYLLFNKSVIPALIEPYLSEFFALFSLLMVLRAFGERKYPKIAWLLILLNHFWIVLAVNFNEHFDFDHTLIFLSGILPASLVGYVVLHILANKEPNMFSLNQYYGHSFEYKNLSVFFLLSCLGLMGFPITISFIGEDLILSHIHEDDFLLAFIMSLSFVMGGIAGIRMYARLFLGPHIKTYHAVPFKNS